MESRPGFAIVDTFNFVACFVVCWGLLLFAMGRGFEFTDEAYYLIWASNPFIYSWSPSQFGFVWHALYEVVGGDIGLFRLGGAVVLSACAFIFGCALWSFLAPRLRPTFDITFVLALMTASLWSFVPWIPSPSYNQLNLCGLLLLLAGLISVASIKSDSSALFKAEVKVVGAAVIAAVGCCICALAKPTTALAAMAIGGIWIAALRPPKALLFIGTSVVLAAAFMFAAVVMIDGSLAVYLDRNITALRVMTLLGSYGVGDIWRGVIDPVIDIATDPLRRGPVIAMVIAGILWLLGVSWTNGRLGTWAVAFPLAIVVGLARASDEPYWFSFSLIAPLILLLAFTSVLSLKILRSRDPDWRRYSVLVCLLAITPFCFSIGTNNRLIYHASAAAVFWFAAMSPLAVLAAPANRGSYIHAVKAACGFLTAGMLVGALTNPYRLESSIWNQNQVLKVGARAAPLLVDRLTADYISVLRQAAQGQGFQPGTPVIDLTGESPGTVFAIGGEAPGSPWLAGGYPGSLPVVRDILGRVPKAKLSRAWILTAAPQGVGRALPESTLTPLGLDFPNSYEEVARSHFVRNGDHILWKPKSLVP
jgi:hypothetical protein